MRMLGFDVIIAEANVTRQVVSYLAFSSATAERPQIGGTTLARSLAGAPDDGTGLMGVIDVDQGPRMERME